MGWGTTTEGGYLSDVLLEVDLPVVSNEDCDQCYQFYWDIYPSMICAYDPGHDSCQGDSGKLIMECDHIFWNKVLFDLNFVL